MENFQSNASGGRELENDIENSTKTRINELTRPIVGSENPKDLSDTQLGQLRSSYEELTADLKELKGAQERVAVLEGEVAMRERKQLRNRIKRLRT